MQFTDLFIKRPVLAIVISLVILVLGLRSLSLLSIQQYPHTQNATITVSTAYTGADPNVIAGFITTPLEYAIAQADGIDYMTSSSTQSTSTISVYLRLNYDAQKALADINSKVNATLNQLPRDAHPPVISIQTGQTIAAMYLGFYSDLLTTNQVTDYLLRVVQPKLQSVEGIQQAELRGDKPFAMRIWLDPIKLAGLGLNAQNIRQALANNNVISAIGRTDGDMVTMNLTARTNLSTVDQFRNMIIALRNGAAIRLKDIATVSLGATNYNSAVSFNNKKAVYIGIQVTPTANLLTVIKNVKSAFQTIQQQLPTGLKANIVYDSTDFVNRSIYEVLLTLVEALIIVTTVIFLFLSSVRSVMIPLITIPLSLIGVFFVMLLLGYSINLLTLLALILAIGLVVDDAIIVVENVQRYMEKGENSLQAALRSGRELANPIIAISLILVAVYLPIGFMTGLTGALFTEFAFTLAGSVTLSAIVALTLSPMMCAKLLISPHLTSAHTISAYVNQKFETLRKRYHTVLQHSLNFLPVTLVFCCIIFISIYFLYAYSQKELAPAEDQGIIIMQVQTAPNATLAQTQLYAKAAYHIVATYPEANSIFQIDGMSGLNNSIIGMGLKPWDLRKRTTLQLLPVIQNQLNQAISGAKIAAFQLPSLPGSQGLPIQFVIKTTDSFEQLNMANQNFLTQVQKSGLFLFTDTNLKIDKAQSNLVLNRDKAAALGLTMQDISALLGAGLNENYVNYFNLDGRAYEVIAQMVRTTRQNPNQLLQYYINTSNGMMVPLATIASLKTTIVPESINHFQQLNSATFSAVPMPGVTTSDALETLQQLAQTHLPKNYMIDYSGESRQYMQESSALMATFLFALVIIFLALAALFESFRDPIIVLISVPMSICGAFIFINLGLGGISLNIYTEVGLITLIGLISKHGILIVQFANDLQLTGLSKRQAIETAASIRLRPILMTTAAMVLGVAPLITATGAGAMSRYNIGLVIASGTAIGTIFTLFVVPAIYLLLAATHHSAPTESPSNATVK